MFVAVEGAGLTMDDPSTEIVLEEPATETVLDDLVEDFPALLTDSCFGGGLAARLASLGGIGGRGCSGSGFSEETRRAPGNEVR